MLKQHLCSLAAQCSLHRKLTDDHFCKHDAPHEADGISACTSVECGAYPEFPGLCVPTEEDDGRL